MGIRCDSCGRPAPEGASFRRVRRGFRCPTCFGRRQHLWHRLVWLGFLALTAVVLVMAARPAWRLAALVPLGAWLFLALLPVTLVAHEAGHALAAWLLRLRVFTFTLGHGRLLGSVRLLGVRWQLRALLNAGTTEVAHPSTRFFRLRHFLLVLAGPLTNAALLAAALWWWSPAVLYRRAAGGELAGGHFVAATFAWANCLLLVGSLAPLRRRQGGATLNSDGWELLATPFCSRAAVEASHARYFARQGDECMWEGRYAEALGWFERGLALYPERIVNTCGVALARLALQQFDQARQGLDSLLARQDLAPPSRAALADAVATVILGQVVRGRVDGEAPARLAERVAEGERWSEEALNGGSGLPLATQWSLMGTYGALRVERGLLEEGERILRLAVGETEYPRARAWCLGYLAVVAARQGREAEARASLEKARRLAPGHLAVERAEWELARAPEPAARSGAAAP
jgi:tetratricopeptide (TPR) repeat protein